MPLKGEFDLPTPAQSFDDAREQYDAADRELDALSLLLEATLANGIFSDRVVGLGHRVLVGLKEHRDVIHLEGLMGREFGVGSDVYAAGMGVEGRDIPYADRIQLQISRRDKARRDMRAASVKLTPSEVQDRAHLFP